MSIFRAVATEVLDDEFRSYIRHRNAQLSYCQPMSFGSHFYDELQDRLLYRFDIFSMDRRRIDIGPERHKGLGESGKIIVRTFKNQLLCGHIIAPFSMQPKIVDTADPAVDPVEAIREHIRGFLYLHAITRSHIYMSHWVVDEQR